ncbi:uncharacterized protein DSM5745_09116 [Aspergillus mulundensis]|uniref:Uncharacterized protein n=1 Tax=Aspergillus mulundensis TaxID=1810919 RepID=A0A3D8R008_9EURO|nr:hypothetical protein DSM5745_09116 [Aspergillus mulundensis]RDW67250.1 hypothetical protein DSM5745_09116 [Aspergillus mulundensis]
MSSYPVSQEEKDKDRSSKWQIINEEYEFYPSNTSNNDIYMGQLGDHIVSAFSTMAFALPGPIGALASAGISLGWWLVRTDTQSHLQDTTYKLLADNIKKQGLAQEVMDMNLTLKETISWLKDREADFKTPRPELKDLMQTDYLAWLVKQSQPDGVLVSILDKLLSRWTGWYDHDIETTISLAITCFFLCFNRRCWIYANFARQAHTEIAEATVVTPELIAQYNRHIAELRATAHMMRLEIDRRTKEISDKITTMKAARKTSIGPLHQVSGETQTVGYFIDELDFEPSALSMVEPVFTRHWCVRDNTAQKTVKFVEEARLPTGQFLLWSTNYAWQDKRGRGEQLHREYLDRLQRHVDRHFVQAPKILAVCARYLADAEKLMKPAEDLGAPRILNLAPSTTTPSNTQVAYRVVIEQQEGGQAMVKTPWTEWTDTAGFDGQPKLLIGNGAAPADARCHVYRLERKTGDDSVRLADEIAGELVETVQCLGLRIWSDKKAPLAKL